MTIIFIWNLDVILSADCRIKQKLLLLLLLTIINNIIIIIFTKTYTGMSIETDNFAVDFTIVMGKLLA